MMSATASAGQDEASGDGEKRVKNPFNWYSYVVLGILFMMRLCYQQQQ